MRILVGLTLLFLTFGLAAWWQRRTLNEMRLQRGAASGVTSVEAERLPGWGELVVGEPSGADPVERPLPPTATDSGAAGRGEGQRGGGERAGGAPGGVVQPPPTYPPPYELRIRSGQRLWSLLERHYGHVGPGLVQEIADYNGLADANVLEVDQLLLLPSEEELALLRVPGR